MKEIGLLLMLLVALVLGMAVGIAIESSALKEFAQTSHPELRSMKEECEKDIPRSQNCEATIIYMPVAGY